ncbi:hypothetical protein LVD15_21935 [Fulvivirga maritima]|uniref:hypothetical protein n=1 Tax=Fulvivirga maritima TaxID=2904247 RepID=UPI001F411C87|nr:hypothetical protein [Fulvivirga maritima]UII25934.1 hypothetical protein LVD15_21935 [Fulvivirga maritima]
MTTVRTAQYIDDHFLEAEYSADLLLRKKEELTLIGQLQQNKVSLKLSEAKPTPPHHLFKVIGLSFIIVLSCWGISFFLKDYQSNASIVKKSEETKKDVTFHSIQKSENNKVDSVKIASAELFINYPSYTKRPTQSQTMMNAEVLEGSRLTWKLSFNEEVSRVALDWNDRTYPMIEKNGEFYRSFEPAKSGFYNFTYRNKEGDEFLSDLFNIQIVKDQEPVIEIEGINQYTALEFDSNKKVSFKSVIQDDYGISEAFIIATVSQGSGESVKFREERLSFDNELVKGKKDAILKKTINLDQLDIHPGDELYFYVEAIDNKRPVSQNSRSETYFVVIQDTTTYEYTMDASLGADVMPEYFRSQRQIIIDSEKLLNESGNIPDKTFKDRSNSLAFDQKALRLKYGQFLGEEAESGIDVSPEEQVEIMMQNDSEDDPLAAYMHDHDGGEGEREVEVKDHGQSHSDHEHSQNNLEAYTHNHDNSEEATFYTVSVKSKLKQALSEMWNAELYLRLSEPEKSLPYQYKALKLIKEIKNDARIYVHRIGFDPPPIKEKSRLTGDIDQVNSHSVNSDFHKSDSYKHIRMALPIIHEFIDKEKATLNKNEKLVLKKASEELAQEALFHPGKYLHSLQALKRISQKKEPMNYEKRVFQIILKDLITVLPHSQTPIQSKSRSTSDWNVLMFEELKQQQYDR